MIKLKVYYYSLDLYMKLYEFTQSAKLSRDFALVSQLTRAATSIPTNISEGYMRSRKVFRNHLSIAIGSTNEVRTLLVIASRVYRVEVNDLEGDYSILAKQLMSLRKRLL
jgi:four helix bundle protein